MGGAQLVADFFKLNRRFDLMLLPQKMDAFTKNINTSLLFFGSFRHLANQIA